MIAAMKKWEDEDGVRFLMKIGIKTGQTVLDLSELIRKIQTLNLRNIFTIQTQGRVLLDYDTH